MALSHITAQSADQSNRQRFLEVDQCIETTAFNQILGAVGPFHHDEVVGTVNDATADGAGSHVVTAQTAGPTGPRCFEVRAQSGGIDGFDRVVTEQRMRSPVVSVIVVAGNRER